MSAASASLTTSHRTTTTSTTFHRTTTSSKTTTEFTAALALTTPFVPSPTCLQNVWDVHRTAYETTNYTSTPHVATFSFTALATADLLTCQLSGWSSLTSASYWSLSPAVCPSGWTAYDIKTAYSSPWMISTANCCERDFTFYGAGSLSYIPSVHAPCTRWFSSDVTVTLPGSALPMSTTTVTSGLQAHPAWIVSWHKNNTETMSPRPPTIPESAVIRSWVPGTDVNETNVVYENPEHGSPFTVLYGFLVIGLPIIFCTILVASTCCCCRRAKTRKERRRQAARALELTDAPPNHDAPPKYEHSSTRSLTRERPT